MEKVTSLGGHSYPLSIIALALAAIAPTVLTGCGTTTYSPAEQQWQAKLKTLEERIVGLDPIEREIQRAALRRQHQREIGPKHDNLGVQFFVEERRPASLREELSTTSLLHDDAINDVRLDSQLALSFLPIDRQPFVVPNGGLDPDKWFDAETKAASAWTLPNPPQADVITKLTDDLVAATKTLTALSTFIDQEIGQVEVSIQAFYSPGEGDRRQVSVANYDTINSAGAGASKPIAHEHRIGRHQAARQASDAVAAGNKLAARLRDSSKFNLAAHANLLQALTAFEAAITSTEAVAKAAAEDVRAVPPDGLIELATLKPAHHDRLEIIVRVSRTAANVTETNDLDFHVRTVQVGVYRQVGGSLIYARADKGPGTAQNWKPNAAAHMEWHYRPYYAENWYEKGIGWLDPGIGFHIASLDQDENEDTELGIGVNMSLWEGFLQGGLGYNLSVDSDHLYYYFGIDLLSVLSTVAGQ